MTVDYFYNCGPYVLVSHHRRDERYGTTQDPLLKGRSYEDIFKRKVMRSERGGGIYMNCTCSERPNMKRVSRRNNKENNQNNMKKVLMDHKDKKRKNVRTSWKSSKPSLLV